MILECNTTSYGGAKRKDRYFVVMNDGSKLYSLRKSAYDNKPIDRKEAIKRYHDQIHNENMVLVELNVVAELTRPKKPDLELIIHG